MNDSIKFEISIPTDVDGFVLMQCEYCGDYFKCKPSDVKDDEVLFIHCPSCGLVSEDYLTDDIRELAMTMAENYASEYLNNELKKLERRFSSNKFFKIKVENKSKPKYESPIYSSIDALEEKSFVCCERSAKIKSILKMSACYCPFCGGITFEDE
ncbi:MAG: TFIIB-type zinc ribbon-containing protein [Ruminococcaceae bacterium]|nr:TFIIB-type zinc ribbon-containing protein [Oscillospiraceae bacterium]